MEKSTRKFEKAETTEQIDNLFYEKDQWSQGIKWIGGVDECGRGPLAGPVVAGCVVMPEGLIIEGLTDSKKIKSEKARKAFSLLVYEHALAWGIGSATVEEIDQINIRQATILAMTRAVNEANDRLSKKAASIDFLLLDGIETLPLSIPQKAIKKGDFLSHSIGCAAMIAKVYRDELMEELDKKYDGIYAWSKNKGYYGKPHQKAVAEYGITPDHRQTFAPCLTAKKNLQAFFPTKPKNQV